MYEHTLLCRGVLTVMKNSTKTFFVIPHSRVEVFFMVYVYYNMDAL